MRLVVVMLSSLTILALLLASVPRAAAFTPPIPAGDTPISSGYGIQGNGSVVRLFYWAGYKSPPSSGGFFSFDQVIENQGQVLVRITRMTYITDFLDVSNTLGVPFNMTSNDGRIAQVSFPTPSDLQIGNHTLISWIAWQYYSSSTSTWVNGDDIVVHGQFLLARNQSSGGPVQSSLSRFTVFSLGLLLFLGALLVVIVVIAVLLIVRSEERKHEALGQAPSAFTGLTALLFPGFLESFQAFF